MNLNIITLTVCIFTLFNPLLKASESHEAAASASSDLRPLSAEEQCIVDGVNLNKLKMDLHLAKEALRANQNPQDQAPAQKLSDAFDVLTNIPNYKHNSDDLVLAFEINHRMAKLEEDPLKKEDYLKRILKFHDLASDLEEYDFEKDPNLYELPSICLALAELDKTMKDKKSDILTAKEYQDTCCELESYKLEKNCYLSIALHSYAYAMESENLADKQYFLEIAARSMKRKALLPIDLKVMEKAFMSVSYLKLAKVQDKHQQKFRNYQMALRIAQQVDNKCYRALLKIPIILTKQQIINIHLARQTSTNVMQRANRFLNKLDPKK